MMHESIIKHYEECLEKYKGTSKEVDWPNKVDANIRYERCIRIATKKNHTLLDYGCGTGSFVPWIHRWGTYYGCDASNEMILEARFRNAHIGQNFFKYDIATDVPLLVSSSIGPNIPREFTYVICNGVFTIKRDLTQAQMMGYVVESMKRLFKLCTHGMAVNFMDPYKCDSLREDLFFLDYHEIALLAKIIGCTSYVINADYGLRESMTYFYK